MKQNPDKCKRSGKNRDDRVALSKTSFAPLSVDVTDPSTAILLLKSREHSALVTAAASLSKYGSKSSANLEILFDLNIVDLLLPLIRHEEVFTRRFATKLLAEMSTLKNVRNFLLNSECYLPYFADVLANDTDIVMHEFVTFILSELSNDMFGVAQLLKHCNSFDFIFQQIASPDPDVKKNSIEVVYHLLKDPIGAHAIVNTKNFNFSSIYELVKQPYPVIQQLTLDVINLLVARNQDENIQELFRGSLGLHTLLDILDKDALHDLHEKTLKTLSSACDNQETADLLVKIGGVQKFSQYVDSFDKELNLDFLNIISRLANSPDGRKELYKHDIVPNLLSLMQNTSNPDAAGVSCKAIARMLQYGPAAEAITSSNPIPKILGFIKNENIKPSARHAAIYCLAELLTCDAKNCYNLLETGEQFYLLRMIKQPVDGVSLEIQMAGLQCLVAISHYPELREQIIDTNLIDALLVPIERKNHSSLMAEYKIAYCNALATFCIENTARNIFLGLEGPRVLYNLLLYSGSVPVQDAVARLIAQLATDQVVAPQLILVGCLEYMIRHRSASRSIPSWEACIRSLFNSYLPAKFALTGRLSLHDITNNGFYVMRHNTSTFTTLDQLFTLKMNPTQTIYTCTFTQPDPLVGGISEMEEYAVRSEFERNTRSKSADDKDRTCSIYNDAVTKAIAGEQHAKSEVDPFLDDLIKLFKCKLIAAEIKAANERERPGLVNMCHIKSRAKMLGEFIARQMSGPDSFKKCIDHQLELHLNEIKHDIGTNVIPLGQLRVASYLERALLFKVIADRICLPAALVRGDYGRSWVEIALPEIGRSNKREDFHDSALTNIETINDQAIGSLRSSSTSLNGGLTEEQVSIDKNTSFILPTGLLRPNYLVDLIDTPGELIPLGSKRAEEYCGLW